MNFDKLAVGPNPPHGINCHRRGAAALRSDQVSIRQDRGGDRGRTLPVHDEILPLYLGFIPTVAGPFAVCLAITPAFAKGRA